MQHTLSKPTIEPGPIQPATYEPQQNEAWHSLTPTETLLSLDVVEADGLNTCEAERRRTYYGANELREQPRPGFLQRLLHQFASPLVLLLIGASGVSGGLGEWPEAITILLIVVVNAVLGVVQEGRAERALSSLRRLSAREVLVRREGQTRHVPERELVPGDIVLLEAGNIVPADLRLLETHNLKADEATLTGESLAVEKDAALLLPKEIALGDCYNMAFKGTTVTYGRGTGVVIRTGMATEIGGIAQMIQEVDKADTPLQLRLAELGRWLVFAALGICGLVFLVAFGREIIEVLSQQTGAGWGERLKQALSDAQSRKVLSETAVESFMVSVALAIAAVPEGLPAIVTINLALGMREMIKRNAIVRRLNAVETLGCVSVICSDKTGTLTQNEMTVVRLFTGNGWLEVSGDVSAPDGSFSQKSESTNVHGIPDVEKLFTGAVLASDAHLELQMDEAGPKYHIVGDPTEGALIIAAANAGVERSHLESQYPRLDEIPFDSDRKRMSTLHRDENGDHLLFVKGAPDMVLDRCQFLIQDGKEADLTPARLERIRGAMREMSGQALRVLAVAYRSFDQRPTTLNPDESETELTFLGLIGMHDAPRPEAGAAIARARRAGIKTVMVTGDFAETAQAVGRQIGLLGKGDGVLTGSQLEQMSDDELAKSVDSVTIFARVSPVHKVRIAQAFRQRKHIVAMTGDGVNDAPALKQADIGVAMGLTGADVTKETADIVLTDDNYASIVGAVEQGRIIYDNIRKFVSFLLGSNLAEIVVIFVTTLFGYPIPFTPLQLLWVNLLSDGAPALALGVEKGDPDVMERPARPADESIINPVMRLNIAVQASAIATVTLIAYFIFLRRDGLADARCAAFATLTVSEILLTYAYRSERFSVFQIGLFTNRYLQYAAGVSAALLLAVVYIPFLQPVFSTVPLSLGDWSVVLPLSLLPFLLTEATKWNLRRVSRGSD